MRIKRVVDAIERAVPAPQIEIIVQRRARRQIRRNRAPLTAGAQDIHQAVDDLAHHDMTPFSTALGRRNERLHKRPFRELRDDLPRFRGHDRRRLVAPAGPFGHAAAYFVLSQTNRRMCRRLVMPIFTLARAMPIVRTMRPIGPF